MHIVGTAGHVDHGKSALIRGAHGNQSRSFGRGAGSRNDARSRLRAPAIRRRRSKPASSTFPGTSVFCITCSPAPPEWTCSCSSSMPTKASCRRRSSISRSQLLNVRRMLVVASKIDLADAAELDEATASIRRQWRDDRRRRTGLPRLRNDRRKSRRTACRDPR